uniref:Uncharacterized protein n=1 Tax=Romanomermis culicivorax TaxID=13658 RepID=A0A915HNL2_ROMCU
MADATPPPAAPDAASTPPATPSTAGAAAPAGVPIQVVPAENEYKGTLPAKAVHTVTNTGTAKQCIKLLHLYTISIFNQTLECKEIYRQVMNSHPMAIVPFLGRHDCCNQS